MIKKKPIILYIDDELDSLISSFCSISGASRDDAVCAFVRAGIVRWYKNRDLAVPAPHPDTFAADLLIDSVVSGIDWEDV